MALEGRARQAVTKDWNRSAHALAARLAGVVKKRAEGGEDSLEALVMRCGGLIQKQPTASTRSGRRTNQWGL